MDPSGCSVDHTFGGGGGVGRWRVTQYLRRLWRRGYGASRGLVLAQSWCQVLPDGYSLPLLHLDFTPDREVAKITCDWLPALLAASKAFSSSP